MNRKNAKEIAETVSLEDLKQMFINAQNNIKDWTQVSNVNKGLTKGTAFNILSYGIWGIDEAKEIHIMAKINMIREFGEFLPNYQKKTKTKKILPQPKHEEPIFIKQT